MTTFRNFRDFFSRGDYKNALIEYHKLKAVSSELVGALTYEHKKIRDNLDYIVSLTSWPGRIHLCHKTIESILLQNEKPKKVVLWLANEEFPDGEKSLPLPLKNLQSDNFSIEWCKNVYSYKKLIPSLINYPAKIIITADDDVIYPKNWLTLLLNAHMEDPEAAFGHRVRKITFRENGEIAPYIEWERYKGAGVAGDFYFITGVSGALYPPGAFHPDILNNRSFLKLCRYGDDIWFWAMLCLARTRIRPIANGTKWQPVNTVEGTQDSKLWEENQQGRNDRMLRSVLDRYPSLAKMLGTVSKSAAIPPKIEDKIDVSVIMPVYNTEAYLDKCIQRILDNKSISIELIIIDDGSTDASPAIIDSYQKKDSRVMVITKANAGQGAARNLGMKIARGEYLYFMDSDDYLGNDALTALYNTAKTKNLDLCSLHIPFHYFDRPLEYVCCIPTRGQFIKTAIVRQYEITQPEARSGQDGVFSFLYFTHCERIGMCETIRCTKNQRDDSTFARFSKSNHDAVTGILHSHYEHITRHFDQHDLWTSNSRRLLQFMIDESFRNRIDPHFDHLSPAAVSQCFSLLKTVAEKCAGYLNDTASGAGLHPLIRDLLKHEPEAMIKLYRETYLHKEVKQVFPVGKNYKDGSLYICINANPAAENKNQENNTSSRVQKNKTVALLDNGRAIERKLDYLLQTVNNNYLRTISALHDPAQSLLTGDKSFVVSLTTLPGRLETVHLTIESILAQDHKPGKIVLWLGEQMQALALPAPLLEQTKRGLKIEYVPDVGPQTKLLYALKRYPDKNIITVDDDIVYPANMLGALKKWHERFPEAVIANWARQLAFDSNGKVKPVRAGKLLNTNAENSIEPDARYAPKPDMLGYPYGTAGVLYPPGALNDRVFDIATFRRLCPAEDDVWFRAMGILNHTPVVVTDLGMRPIYFGIPGSQTEALRYINHEEKRNHEQLLAVFEELGLYDKISEFNNCRAIGVN